MNVPVSKPKNRLTLYIILALLLGVICGSILQKTWLANDHAALIKCDLNINQNVSALKLINDTLNPNYATLKSKIHQNRESQQKISKIINDKIDYFSLVSDIFLRLIKMIIAPLVFCTLAAGVAKLGDIKQVGRIGAKTLVWFLGASLLSLFLGMLLVNVFQPGQAMHLSLPEQFNNSGIQKVGFTLREFAYHVFPTSIFDAMAKNEILQMVLFAIIFGIAAASLGNVGKIVIQFLEAAGHIILRMTGYIMQLAPVAVFCAMTAVIAKQGLGILSTYGIFILEFYLGLLMLWILLSIGGFIFLRGSIFQLLSRIKSPILLAFSTSSSESAFPKTLEELERYGCPNRIVSFVLPLGYSFNLDGSMMYMTFASIFIAQCYGIHLGFDTQITMLLVLMLTSKGIAGVPRASLVVIAGTLASFKIPEAGMALLLGIDPILDMGRAATNVLGNSIATAVISKTENNI